MGSITAGQVDGAAGGGHTPGRLSARRLPIWLRVSAVVFLALAGIVALAMVLGAEGVGSTGGHGSGGGHESTEMEMRDDAPTRNHGAGGEGDHGTSGRGSQGDHRSDSDRSTDRPGSDHGSR